MKQTKELRAAGGKSPVIKATCLGLICLTPMFVLGAKPIDQGEPLGQWVTEEYQLPLEAVEVAPICYESMFVPSNKGAVAWMSYKAITKVGSPQYWYRDNAWTDDLGYRRYEDYYLVAMGQYYGKVGDRFQITFDDGSTYKILLGDLKAGVDTFDRIVGTDGSLIEYIVDTSVFVPTNLGQFRATVIAIEKEI